MHLRQSTASQSIVLGQFVDETDGFTAETGLTIANTDILASKNGAAMAALAASGGTHDSNGWYTVDLDATDTDTVGRLQISCLVAGARVVEWEAEVLDPEVYDSLYADASVALATAVLIGTPLTDVIADLNALVGTPITDVIADLNALVGTPVTDISADIAAVVTLVGTPATDVSTDIAAVNTLIGTPVSTVSADLAALQTDVTTVNTATSNIETLIGTPVSTIAADIAALQTDITSIKTALDTLKADWDEDGRLDVILDAAGVAGDPLIGEVPGAYAAGTVGYIIGNNLNAPVATIDTVVDAIKAKTDNLPTDPADQSLVIAATDAITTAIGNLNDVDVAAILAGTGDTGVSLAKAIEMVAALVAGKVTVNSAAGVTTITYKKRNGTTTSFTTVVTEADKTRATTGALS